MICISSLLAVGASQTLPIGLGSSLHIAIATIASNSLQHLWLYPEQHTIVVIVLCASAIAFAVVGAYGVKKVWERCGPG